MSECPVPDSALFGPSNNRLIYILEWEAMSERELLWNAFIANPECIARKVETEPDGHSLLTDVDNQLLKPAAFFSLANHD
jgi:hypothetical protein